ncbi:nucleotidyltransferase domain-containing protein [Actinomadura flavalba]|uniref:nucleotidyltransferase domain-containing protein n=1 Tax=Actinomadura flavalba TaxID=1120938 RepID=UPI00036E5ACD|nr:nucleotidyltransferase domain-containing protein [Actinomadura flavalba]
MRLPEGLHARMAELHPYPRAFVTVSGAHLYGFPSADSDVDLRGVHLLPLEELVGLTEGRTTFTRMWDHDGVEADVVTHDLAKFCTLLLRRSGDVLEQLASPLVVETTPQHEELRGHLPRLVTTRFAHHYLGFGQARWRAFQEHGGLKALLYTHRALHTGIHLMRTGEVEADLTRLAPEYGPDYLPDLIAAKAAAERGGLPSWAPSHARLADDVAGLVERLTHERDKSNLPDESPAEVDLHAFVVRVRLGRA